MGPWENPAELPGVDLSGWRVEVWHELVLPIGEECEGREVAGYFKDQSVGMAAGRGEGSWGRDGELQEVLVLTPDGNVGFLLRKDKVAIRLSPEETLRDTARQVALDKLEPEDREILGLEETTDE